MIACVFGLTACGGEVNLTEYEQQKTAYAEQLAVQKVVPIFANLMEEEATKTFKEYTADELEYMFSSEYSLNIDGYGVISGVSSFQNAAKSVGNIVSIGKATSKIDGDQIVVLVDVEGEKKNATAEVIISNDMFMVVDSVSLNPSSTISQLMEKAALDTLIGMGTVFVVLILIIFIINCLAFVPKIQAKFSREENDIKTESINKTVEQIAKHEENVEVSDDLELVAVIAAAIAASQGAASTDGFVVRSIRKRIRSRY